MKKNKYNKDFLSKMIPANIERHEQIEEMLIGKLSSVIDFSVLHSNDGHYILDSKNHFGFQVAESDIIVFYPLKEGEHHHIMGMNYETVEEWTSDAADFILLFMGKSVQYEYHYQGKTHMRTRIISIDENGAELEIENVGHSLNLFKIASKKTPRIETQIIQFRQQ